MKGRVCAGEPSQGLISLTVGLNVALGQHRAPEKIFPLSLPPKKRGSMGRARRSSSHKEKDVSPT